jgi:integrase
MAGSFVFTKKSIDALLPTEERQYYRDQQVPGLQIGVTPKGTKVFYLKYRTNQGLRRISIGRYPQVEIAVARKRATELAGMVAAGRNPAEDLKQGRGELTLGQAFTEYMSRHAKAHKKSWQQDQGHYDRHLAHWARRRLSTLTHSEVQRLHTTIGEKNGKYVANRVLALLRTLFGKLKAWGLWQGENPAVGIQRFKEQPRQRFLSKAEIAAFLRALDEEPDQVVADLLRMCLLTGARKSNVLTMRWDQIDRLDAEAVWTIPDTKAGHPVEIALSADAVAALLRRHAVAAGSPWVFPGEGASGHYEDPKRAFGRACERAGIENATIHTLRHTFASWMTIAGFNLQIVGKALGHRSLRSTQVYAHLTLDPVRFASQATAAMMTSSGADGAEENAASGGLQPLAKK